jgi:hypothetical protein
MTGLFVIVVIFASLFVQAPSSGASSPAAKTHPNNSQLAIGDSYPSGAGVELKATENIPQTNEAVDSPPVVDTPTLSVSTAYAGSSITFTWQFSSVNGASSANAQFYPTSPPGVDEGSCGDASGTLISGTIYGGTYQATCTLPSTAVAGSYTPLVQVEDVGGLVGSASGTPIEVVGPPTISGFSPASGPPRTKVTITGTNLEGAISVKVHGIVVKIKSDSADQIVIKLPPRISTGAFKVKTPGGVVKSTTKFTVT